MNCELCLLAGTGEIMIDSLDPISGSDSTLA